MAESLNTRADLATDAIAFMGFPKYGKIMVGDKAMEFFNDKNVNDNMHFPWASIRAVEAHVSKAGKIDNNFYLVLNNKHKIRFSSNESGKILKLIREQIGNDKVLRIPTMSSTIKRLFNRKK
ncbi:DUF956 family protein [Lactovum odontotermitis]